MKKGTIIAIGGHEQRNGMCTVLEKVASYVKRSRLAVATVASEAPEEQFKEYRKTFKTLGVKDVVQLDIQVRGDALEKEVDSILDKVKGVFFVGGDQLKITSQVGDTPVFKKIKKIYDSGGVIAGTSAGASIMADLMVVSGDAEKSHTVGEALQIAAGLSFIRDVAIDQHFSQRGRLNRLLAITAENPKTLGIGIDENTACIFENPYEFYVLGSGAVYVLDAQNVSFSNLAEEAPGRTISIYDMSLHVLSQGDCFSLKKRRPQRLSARKMAKLPAKEQG